MEVSINNIVCNTPVNSSGKLECKYCSRAFQFRDLYERHFYWCEFLWQGKRERLREAESYEQIPNATDQFHMMQTMLVKIAKLEKEIAHLRNTSLVRKRVAILQFLEKSPQYRPLISFQQWIREIPVTFEDLESVFAGDLVEGMKHSITRLLSSTNATCLPICAFQQKKDTLYIYSRVTNVETGEITNKWMILSPDEWDRCMNRFAHRFLQEFIKWQHVNSEKIHLSEQDKEKHVEYMRKINGLGKSYEDRRRTELRKWLYSQFARDIQIDQMECEYL